MHDTVSPSPRRVLSTGFRLAAFLAVAHTVTDTFASMLTALLPTLQVRFGLTESALALLVATLSFSTSVTQPFLGALADRYSARLIGALGLILVGTGDGRAPARLDPAQRLTGVNGDYAT